MTDKISALIEKLKENPENRFHRYNLAQAFFDSGEYQKAKLEFIYCLEQSKDWMMVLLFVAKCDLALGDFTNAKKYLNKTIQVARDQGHDDPLLEAESLLQGCSNE